MVTLVPSDRNSHSLGSSSTPRFLLPCLGALRWCDGGRAVQESMLEIWCLPDRLSAILQIITMTRGTFFLAILLIQLYNIIYQCCDANDIPKMPGIYLFWTWFSPMSFPIHHHPEIFTHVYSPGPWDSRIITMMPLTGWGSPNLKSVKA